MKAGLIAFAAFFSALIIAVSAAMVYAERKTDYADKAAEQIVALNEITKLREAGDDELADQKTRELRESLQKTNVSAANQKRICVVAGAALLTILIMTGSVYVFIVRPCDKMEKYAGRIARGDLDFRIEQDRRSLFVRNIWAFDSMRRELKRSRDCEKEAIENNKTVVATLSHDIKTPVASIRAYAEGLEAGMDKTPEKRAKYLSVIMRKCDEVAKLTDDLFLHSLADMERLKISPEKIELKSFLEAAAEEIAGSYDDLRYTQMWDPCYVCADPVRLTQALENLVNNARKYARTDIELRAEQDERYARIYVRDFGEGIPAEDEPFIFGKFYRGSNCGTQQGSGLGLYIVKYLVEKMGGVVTLNNRPDGLEVVVELVKIEISN